MAYNVSNRYKSIIYSGDSKHKLKLLFNGVELADADVYCESLKVSSRILPNGSTRFSLDNFIAKEAEIILHDIDTTKIQSPVNISIGTLVDGTYEYVPIGLFVVQDLPTTDSNKTTIKLRDYAVKFDFGYNAKDIIDENGGSVTKLQILQDICNKAGVETDITKFYGSNSKIGIYDNTITGRTYISYLAEQAGAIATIDRTGKLIFVQLKDLQTQEIPLEIVEKYEDGEKYEISRVVYEDAIRKFEYGDESKDTLFINTANPYIENNVLTDIALGSKIEISDSSDNPVVSYKQYGYTKQNVYSGKQLFDVNDRMGSPSATKDENDWITITTDNSQGTTNKYINWWTYPSQKIKENTKYAIIVEVKEVSGTGYVNICGTQTNSKAQFTPGYTLYFDQIKTGIYKQILTSVTSDIEVYSMLRTFATFLPGASGSITFRISVIEDTNVSTDNFVYEPYVGGKASPSPDYPQEIEVGRGKNLLSEKTETANNTYFYKDNGFKIKAGTTYTISCDTTFAGVYIVRKDDNTNLFVAYNKTVLTFTPTEDTLVYFNFYYTNEKSTKYQLEKGSIATKILPYNTIESKSNGKNLFNIKNMTSRENLIVNEDKTITLKAQYNNRPPEILSKLAPNLKIGEEYTLNFETTSAIKSMYLDNAKVYWAIGKSLVITQEMLESYPYFYGSADKEDTISKIQIEPGKVATEYQEYQESSITYDLGDNFLADKDYIENGVLNKNVLKVILDGSDNDEQWTLYSPSAEGISFALWKNGMKKGFGVSLCDKYTNVPQAWGSKYKNSFGIYSDHQSAYAKYFRPPNADITTVEQWKAWLNENPITMYYELETPEQIQLETTGELRTFEPNTIITNDLNSEMEVECSLNQTQVSQILQLNKNIPINSFKTGRILGNPAIDAYDIIKIVDGNKEFKTLATNDLTYNGVIINTFDTQIGKEAKKENVTLTPEATFKKWAKTEIDNVEAKVTINTGTIETVRDEMGNMYTKGQVNELIANAETGVTNTFSEAGGNNIFRNTGLWFVNSGEGAETNPYEFWEGKANEGDNAKATNYRSIKLVKGSFIQDAEVPNGKYSISFFYKKLISNAIASVVINDKEYELDSTDIKQFFTGEQDSKSGEYIVDPIVVSNNHIKIEFKCDALDGVEVYDLMCNKGSVKLAYSQNQNETTTSTVNISQGITITSSKNKNTKFKADYDGIRILDGTNTPKTTFTDKGTETDELVVRKKATITGLLHQEVDDQTWVTKI